VASREMAAAQLMTAQRVASVTNANPMADVPGAR
jgi:hypothetical protein